jgi:ketosteroid isomerase-like protein
MSETEIRELLDSRSDAIRSKDIDRLMSFYGPEIVYFDIVPGLQYRGSEALRPRFLDWFDGFEGPIRQEIGQVDVVVSGDVAVAYMLIRAGGTPKGGREVDYWVRGTSCFQRSGDRWLVVHEHVSVPVDFAAGSPAMDLVP